MTTMAAIDRLVHHSVILDMMSVESYRAEEASQQHLLSSRLKKSSSRQVSPDASSSITSPSENREAPANLVVADATSAHVLVVEDAGIETHEVATSHRQV